MPIDDGSDDDRELTSSQSDQAEYRNDQNSVRPGSDNPYAAPISLEHFEDAIHTLPQIAGTTPWKGWGVAIGMAAAVALVVISVPFLIQDPFVIFVLVPVIGLAALAVGIRYSHNTVAIQRGLYLLVSLAFGAAAYICFVPVCFVVGIPVFILGSSASGTSEMISMIIVGTGMFLIVAICGLIFVSFLRLYFNGRYRKQLLEQVMLESENSTSFVLKSPVPPEKQGLF